MEIRVSYPVELNLKVNERNVFFSVGFEYVKAY